MGKGGEKKRAEERTITMFDVIRSFREGNDPSTLIAFLRSGRDISAADAAYIARLLDPKDTSSDVVAVFKRRKKGNPRRFTKSFEIYWMVMELRGESHSNPMPPGAWDAVAERFGLSRKAVESAYQQRRKEMDLWEAEIEAEKIVRQRATVGAEGDEDPT